jgi:hypothetical protein
MAQTAKNRAESPLIPSPAQLDKALRISADRAKRLADAFGLKVPGHAARSVAKKSKAKTRAA